MKIYNLYLNEIDFSKKPSEVSKHKSQVQFVLNVSLAELLSIDKTKIEQILSLGYHPQSLSIVLKEKEKTFSQDQWKVICLKSELIKNCGISFGIHDLKKTWSIDEVSNANTKIQTSSNEIKKLKLTPLEKIFASYLKVTSRKYVSEEEYQHSADSRSIYGVLNSDKIVCVGFAEWMKSILENLNDSNIKVYSNQVQCADENQESVGFHQNLIIYVKDEKYKLDGYYYFDPTWDCGHEFTNLPTLNYFLVPVEDIKNIGALHIVDRHSKLEESEERKEKKAKKHKQQIETFDTKYEEKLLLHFSGEKIQFTKQFLIDYLYHHPDKCEIFADLIFGQNLSSLEDELLDNEIKKEHYQTITHIIAKYNLPIISGEYSEEFEKILNEALDSGNIEKLDSFCKKISDSVLTEDQAIQTIKNIIKDVYEPKISYIQDDIKLKIEELKTLEKDDSWAVYLAERIEELKQEKLQLELEFSSKFDILDKTLEKNKDFRKNITYLSSTTLESIAYGLTPYSYEPINDEDKFSIYLNSHIRSSYKTNIARKTEYAQERIGEISRAIEDIRYKQSDISVIADRIMFNNEMQSLIIEDIQTESKVVDMSCFYKLLINTISKMKPHLSRDKIDQMVDDIINNSIQESAYNYEATSINPFLQVYLSKDQGLTLEQ